MRAIVTLSASVIAVSLFAASASAAPPYVDRRITLPGGNWAFDVGLGVATDSRPLDRSLTGAGFNLEMAVGLTDRVELGVRTGLRAGDDARALHADEYGRLFDRETFGTGQGTMANPELRVRGALTRGDAEIALEGRVVLPFENGTEPGLQFGVPMGFHAGRVVRIDTGVFSPVVFHDPAWIDVHFPLFVWIQASPKLWLGPMAGLRFVHRAGDVADRTDFSLGFGLGYSLAREIDLKTMALFPAVNDRQNTRDGYRAFGAGIGLQFRIE